MNNSSMDLSLALLHDGMLNREGRSITTSLTLNDIQDLARCCKTYGVRKLYIAHPSPILRSLAEKLRYHWDRGYGSTYNPDRKEAIKLVEVVSDLEEAVTKIDLRAGELPVLAATSAKPGKDRISFTTLSNQLRESKKPHLLLFGTGWGMGDALLARADCVLEPICGPGEYNHLSVRSAAAIILDRILGR